MATYLGQLKRLKAQYTRADPGTTISDRAWSQRMLNKASLSRRERLDVFFSAGGRYESGAIEAALRHGCARIHEDERRIPIVGGFKKRRPKGKGKGGRDEKNLDKKAFVVDDEAENYEEGSAEEDLEREEGAYGAYLEHQDEEGEDPEDEDEDWEEASLQEEELKEAWAAGWKAKSQQSDKRKNRGWKPSGKRFFGWWSTR